MEAADSQPRCAWLVWRPDYRVSVSSWPLIKGTLTHITFQLFTLQGGGGAPFKQFPARKPAFVIFSVVSRRAGYRVWWPSEASSRGDASTGCCQLWKAGLVWDWCVKPEWDFWLFGVCFWGKDATSWLQGAGMLSVGRAWKETLLGWCSVGSTNVIRCLQRWLYREESEKNIHYSFQNHLYYFTLINILTTLTRAPGVSGLSYVIHSLCVTKISRTETNYFLALKSAGIIWCL